MNKVQVFRKDSDAFSRVTKPALDHNFETLAKLNGTPPGTSPELICVVNLYSEFDTKYNSKRYYYNKDCEGLAEITEGSDKQYACYTQGGYNSIQELTEKVKDMLKELNSKYPTASILPLFYTVTSNFSFRSRPITSLTAPDREEFERLYYGERN